MSAIGIGSVAAIWACHQFGHRLSFANINQVCG
jgi:hypothetical protein